MYHSLF